MFVCVPVAGLEFFLFILILGGINLGFQLFALFYQVPCIHSEPFFVMFLFSCLELPNMLFSRLLEDGPTAHPLTLPEVVRGH